MSNEENVKELCKKIVEETGDSCHFNFVFDKALIVGLVMDIEQLGMSAGATNNIVGSSPEVASLFYAITLTYINQIKEVMDYTWEQAVYAVTQKLQESIDVIDRHPPIIKTAKKYVHKAEKE